MPLFKYQARDSKGIISDGMIEGPNQQLVSGTLSDKGLSIISLKEIKQGGFASNIMNRIKNKDVVIFSRQFSVMISANIPVVQALKVLVEQTENIAFKIIVSEIADEVNAGARLSDSLSKRTHIFNNFYVSVVRSGETSGKLDEVLSYLADQMERDYDMMHKIRGAMIYPVFVFSGLAVVGTIMMIWVVPKLTDVISESGGELPLATNILIAVSDFLASFWWLIIIAIVVLAVGLRLYIKQPKGRRQFDYLKLKLPIFGPLLQKIYLVRFTRSMHTLISGGVAISQGLQISANISGNAIYKDLIEQTRKEVEAGNSISSVFVKSEEVPTMVGQMMAVGEKTGKMDVILDRVTLFYEREISNVVANLMTLMEPIIMVIMGVAVAVMVAAIIMPMYNMASQF